MFPSFVFFSLLFLFIVDFFFVLVVLFVDAVLLRRRWRCRLLRRCGSRCGTLLLVLGAGVVLDVLHLRAGDQLEAEAHRNTLMVEVLGRRNKLLHQNLSTQVVSTRD